MPSDIGLSEAIKDALWKDDRLLEQRIQVEVANGVVTLHGFVRTYEGRMLAQQIAASSNGCRKVINRLQARGQEMKL